VEGGFGRAGQRQLNSGTERDSGDSERIGQWDVGEWDSRPDVSYFFVLFFLNEYEPR
jgi:hypothetical protein